MGYFAAKILVVALLLLGGLVAFPLGALAAAKRARRKYGRTPSSRGFTGAQCAGVLLHRERLSSVRVASGAAPLAERYSPAAGEIVLSDETAKRASIHAVATAAMLAAKVTLHADGDPDFARAHRRSRTLALLANLLPPVALAGVLVPGEGRALLFVATPLLLLFLAAYTAMSLTGERRASTLALALLDRHGFVFGKDERESLRSALESRAALALAAPLTRCLWISWAL